MAFLLLTSEQAERNLEAFQCRVPSVSNPNVKAPSWEKSIGEVIARASALELPEKISPPPSSKETFSNPKLHLDVAATFLATSMQIVGYTPNSSYQEGIDVQKEARGFADLISDLQRFGSYMPLVSSGKREFTYNKQDCKALLEEVQSFVSESGIESPVIITRALIVQAASLTSKEETHTLFCGFHFQGADSSPSLFIFYGTAKMLRGESGKSTATAEQSIVVTFYHYQILSKLVSEMAEALAITVVPAEKLTESINERFLLPNIISYFQHARRLERAIWPEFLSIAELNGEMVSPQWTHLH